MNYKGPRGHHHPTSPPIPVKIFWVCDCFQLQAWSCIVKFTCPWGKTHIQPWFFVQFVSLYLNLVAFKYRYVAHGLEYLPNSSRLSPQLHDIAEP